MHAIEIVLAALILAVVSGPLAAQDAGSTAPETPKKEEPQADPDKGDGTQLPPIDEKTRALLDKVDKIHRKITSFRAEYKQVRKVRISRRLRKSEGVLFIRKRPEKKSMDVLFVEEKPFLSKVLFSETEVVFYDGETGEIKRRDPREGSVKPSEIWVLGRPVTDIVKLYTPRKLALTDKEKEDDDYAGKLELVPRTRKIGKWVKRVVIWMREEDGLGVRVRIEDHRKGYQEFTFVDVDINPDLDEDTFKIRREGED